MNLPLDFPNDLLREAQNRVLERSLSELVTALAERTIQKPRATKKRTLLEMLGHPATAGRDFPLPERKDRSHRTIEFP